MFTREDWTLFRNLGTLTQKAGVPVHKLRRLVVKELVDNALDAGGTVTFGRAGANTYWVEDTGPGIPGDAAAIATLFSVRRPLTSTKIVRLPVRGALGNGLRVVVGAVLASGGTLEVATRGRHYRLRPLDDGSTEILADSPDDPGAGPRTRITVTLPEGVPADPADLTLGRLAAEFQFAKTYAGKTSPFWYDSDSFHELLQAAGDTPARRLVAFFDGYGDARGEKLPGGVLAGRDWPAACQDFGRADSEGLLQALRYGAAPVKPAAVGCVGNPDSQPYAKTTGVLRVEPGRGSVAADLPYTIEAWATAVDDDESDAIIAFVNGTPVVGEIRVERNKPTKIAAFGCGLSHYVERVSARRFIVRLNVTIPYMPITTDGKEPDFKRLLGPVSKVLQGATRKLKSLIRKQEHPRSQTDIILRSLPRAVRAASGDGAYRFSLRQLYYAVRPFCLDAGHTELAYGHFCKTITDYEATRGEITGMYRDPRGTLYHPHLGTSIPIGTLAVEEYERPEWTFNKILYCEKEGLTHLLVASGWPERNDCALLSSKGFASRAVRDVLDLLGETEQELTFFCIHDADAAGGLIYQALTEATTARAARKVRIINLGLDPWEALDMDLQVESFRTKGDQRQPVARYVRDADEPPPDGHDTWGEWLQGRRVELNAMTSPQFIAWLDEKMSHHDTGKVVPPATVLAARLAAATAAEVRRAEVERILAAADIDAVVAERMEGLAPALAAADPGRAVAAGLGTDPNRSWTGPLGELAGSLALGVWPPRSPS